MIFYVIYRNPKDYPGKHVTRRWRLALGDGESKLVPEAEPLAVTATLDNARLPIPSGAINIGRMPTDDACIVEVWI